jgi:predicted transcriptional regulator
VDVVFGNSVRALRGMTPPIAILNYLIAINLLLGAFNLIPAFPLDGGRVFRSTVWGITRHYSRATVIATTVGQAFGILMIGLGVVRFALGDLFGGLWTVFIGWFLFQAAGASREDRMLRESLQGVPVEAVMDPAVPLVDQDISLQQLVYDYLLRSERRRVIAIQDGVPVGIVEAGAVNTVPREAWGSTPVAAVATPIARTVSPDMDAGELLSQLDDSNPLVPVVTDGHVIGAVDLMRLMRYAQLRKELQAHVGSVRPSTA